MWVKKEEEADILKGMNTGEDRTQQGCQESGEIWQKMGHLIIAFAVT